jgi:hypothetical protein
MMAVKTPKLADTYRVTGRRATVGSQTGWEYKVYTHAGWVSGWYFGSRAQCLVHAKTQAKRYWDRSQGKAKRMFRLHSANLGNSSDFPMAQDEIVHA